MRPCGRCNHLETKRIGRGLTVPAAILSYSIMPNCRHLYLKEVTGGHTFDRL